MEVRVFIFEKKQSRLIVLMRMVSILLVLTFLSSCASLQRLPVPAELAENIEPMGMVNVRSWADSAPDNFDPQDRIQTLVWQNKQSLAHRTGRPIPVAILALSGGGDSGAFGAGLLNGWSEAGYRPKFQMVTGVSTGALIAPFAFLGSKYDDRLEHFYTQTSSKEILGRPLIPNFLKGQSLANSDPLARQLKTHITEDILLAIAKEHASGRRLLVVTTNLDAGRAVLWDMGAIAATGGGEATALFRQVMLASASIPGLMPPVQIEVNDGQNHYTELHADGGIITNVFAYQQQLEIGKILLSSERNIDLTLYVIRNGRAKSLYDPPKPIWFNLMERSMSLMLTVNTNAEIKYIEEIAKRDGLKFRLAAIPNDYLDKPSLLFDQQYMQGLFAYAKSLARQGYPWKISTDVATHSLFNQIESPK